MSAPEIEFHLVNSRDFGKIRSSSDSVRFRVERRVGRTTFDGDWFNTPLELSRSSWRQIESAWNAERLTFPCKLGDCGGGRSCVIVTVACEREDWWREFLRDLLSRSESWLVWDGRRGFVPQKAPLEPAA